MKSKGKLVFLPFCAGAAVGLMTVAVFVCYGANPIGAGLFMWVAVPVVLMSNMALIAGVIWPADKLFLERERRSIVLFFFTVVIASGLFGSYLGWGLLGSQYVGVAATLTTFVASLEAAVYVKVNGTNARSLKDKA